MTLQQGKAPAFRLTTQATLLRVLCAFVLCGILVAGLWPFHAPQNEVSWLSNGNGLFFGDYGSIVSAEGFIPSGSLAAAPCSIEIWLQPALADYSGTILAFYRPESRVVPLALRQSLGDLMLRRTSQDPLHHAKKAKIYIDDLFSHAKPVFVTISSSPAGAAVYADDALVKKSPTFRLSSRDFTGQLIVGNAPSTTDNWSGQVKGLALYDRELTAAEVSQHYANWTKNMQTELTKSEGAVALYLFNEGKGSVVHNQIDSATDLVIPERFFVLRKQFLEPPWNEFYPGWSYWRNISINIAGFMPLGFFFSAYFSAIRKTKWANWLTIALGFTVSLTIEVLQAVLPTRDSGMTDLITNTLGTAFGAMIYANTAVQVVLGRLRYTPGS